MKRTTESNEIQSFNMALPSLPSLLELSDAELEAVAGGSASANCGTNCGTNCGVNVQD